MKQVDRRTETKLLRLGLGGLSLRGGRLLRRLLGLLVGLLLFLGRGGRLLLFGLLLGGVGVGLMQLARMGPATPSREAA